MKKIFFILLIVLPISTYGQENQLFDSIVKKKGIDQLEYVLNLKVSGIPDDGFSKLLKIKLNSELSSLHDLFTNYMFSSDLELSRKELSIIEQRVLYLAEWFVKSKKYVTVKNSGGYSPVIGIRLDTVANKKVLVLLMGGDCRVTEYDKRSDYIYNLFSRKVKRLLINSED